MEKSYYFINHSRKEFALFANNMPIKKGIAEAINSSLGWSLQDDIRIGAEDRDTVTYLEYLDMLKYKLAKLKN
jgi:hypothetical protein